jgi:hypothetical protein
MAQKERKEVVLKKKTFRRVYGTLSGSAHG